MKHRQILRYDILLSFFVACFFLCLYLFFLNDHFTHAHDAPDYYHRILSSPEWHGNHLIYEPFARLWHDFWRDIIPHHVSSFRLIASMNSMFGAILTGILFLYGRCHLGLRNYYGFVFIGIIGFSFYFVTYSATIEIYMPVLCFSFLSLVLVRSMRMTISMAVLVGIIHGVAMLWHQMAFLFGFVIILYFWRHKKCGIIYLLTGSIIVLGSYAIIASMMHIDNLSDFMRLFTGYFSNDKILNDRANSMPYMAIFGLSMALLGGRLLMAIDPFKTMLQTSFADHSIERLIYLHHQTSDVLIAIQLLCYGVLAIGIVYILYHWICAQKRFKPLSDMWILLLLHTVFFTFWYPHNPEFWGVQMICLIAILIHSKPNIVYLSLVFVSLAVINVLGTALPLKNPENDLYGQVITLFPSEK